MAATPEGLVKAKIKAWLKTLGPDVWFYMPVQNGMGVTGIPDIIACIRGRFVAIETKAPGKAWNVSPNQLRQLTGIEHAHGIAMVATSLQAVKEQLHFAGLIDSDFRLAA
jgi:hypothetical protein